MGNLETARIDTDPKETPLFRAALGNRKALSDGPLSANDMRHMLKRKLKDAGLVRTEIHPESDFGSI